LDWEKQKMQIGVIGLGRMGANIVRRLQRGQHECIAYDADGAVVERLAREGLATTASLGDFVGSVNRCSATMSSSMAATRSIRTTSGAPGRCGSAASTISMSAPAAACSGSSVASA
jgi:3-hydroxyisobutyrate dehydrogenase-like beta-hydroxyacid dehydrogenase